MEANCGRRKYVSFTVKSLSFPGLKAGEKAIE